MVRYARTIVTTYPPTGIVKSAKKRDCTDADKYTDNKVGGDAVDACERRRARCRFQLRSRIREL